MGNRFFFFCPRTRPWKSCHSDLILRVRHRPKTLHRSNRKLPQPPASYSFWSKWQAIFSAYVDLPPVSHNKIHNRMIPQIFFSRTPHSPIVFKQRSAPSYFSSFCSSQRLVIPSRTQPLMPRGIITAPARRIFDRKRPFGPPLTSWINPE